EMNEGQAFDSIQNVDRFQQAAAAGVGQVDLRNVSGDDGFGIKSETGDEHFHLLGSGVLCLVENHEGIVQGASAHESDGRDLDDIFLEIAIHLLRFEHVVESVVERTEIGIDFVLEGAGQ